MGRNKFVDICTGWVTNARHRITQNRTIDGMCLDKVVAPGMLESQGERAANHVRLRRFHVDWWPIRLKCFCN
jgi:hypothetical protein